MSTLFPASAIVIGLDIGTTKVSAVVGEIAEDRITVLGVGSAPCRGLSRGVVTNVEWTADAIRQAVDAARSMAGVDVSAVYVGVGGGHIRSQAKCVVTDIAGSEVSLTDIESVLCVARALSVENDRRLLHVLPREYILDAQDGIRDPVGMTGVRLGATVNVISAATSCVDRVVRAAKQGDLAVTGLAAASLASAEAVLSEDEKEIGAAVLDIGGGTVDVLLYVDGSAAHTGVIPMGVVEPCSATMTFAAIRRYVEDTRLLSQLTAGVVLTGGSARLQGMRELAERGLRLPVRVGVPTGLRGLTHLVSEPQFAAATGLVKLAAQAICERQRPPASGTPSAAISDCVPLSKTWAAVLNVQTRRTA